MQFQNKNYYTFNLPYGKITLEWNKWGSTYGKYTLRLRLNTTSTQQTIITKSFITTDPTDAKQQALEYVNNYFDETHTALTQFLINSITGDNNNAD